jgi:serine/threonine protein kinase
MDMAGAQRLIEGRYRLGTVLGRGGMGIVWAAHDELLSRDVAVKEVAWPATLSDEERQAACRRETREAQVAARLSHRNVVRVFDVAEEDGRPWIVMELLPPRSLRDLINQEGPVSPARAARIGLDILAALRAAHAAGILHLDVKPANIVIAGDRAVLTDFGIARDARPSAATTAGLLIGSPSYIAPERARSGQPGPASDLWGLGASLYAAVEGHGPFDREGDALASLTAAVAEEAEPARHAGPLLWPVISGLLRKDPAERLDAAAAERMLRRAADPRACAAASPTAPRARRSVLSAAALAIVASGISAGLALSASPRHATAASLPAAAGRHPKASGSTALTGRPRSAPRRSATSMTASATTGRTAKDARALQTDGLVRATPHGKALGHRHSHRARHAGHSPGAGQGNGDSQD